MHLKSESKKRAKALIFTQLKISRYKQHFFTIFSWFLINWPPTYLLWSDHNTLSDGDVEVCLSYDSAWQWIGALGETDQVINSQPAKKERNRQPLFFLQTRHHTMNLFFFLQGREGLSHETWGRSHNTRLRCRIKHGTNYFTLNLWRTDVVTFQPGRGEAYAYS